ncbi:MAG: hypothetical protein K2F87_02605 [Muribaculaceae bacterium]|nr:hypothetical protein [Muribaculaceae bacterium]
MIIKKFLITLAVLSGIAGIAKGETLREAYGRMAAVEGAKTYDRIETDKNLAELNSNLPMESYTSVQWPYEKGSHGVTAAYNEMQALLSGVEDVRQVLGVNSDYNTFALLVAPAGASEDMLDIMAVWQLNYYGTTFVVYGEITTENLNRLMFGDVQMNHFGVSVRPMSQKFYEDYKKLGEEQNLLWKDQATHKMGGGYKELDKKFQHDAARLQKEVEKSEK